MSERPGKGLGMGLSALLGEVRAGNLDAIQLPRRPLDILAQHGSRIVAPPEHYEPPPAEP